MDLFPNGRFPFPREKPPRGVMCPPPFFYPFDLEKKYTFFFLLFLFDPGVPETIFFFHIPIIGDTFQFSRTGNQSKIQLQISTK